MDVDKAEELQRSIDAVLAKIEERKLALGSLFREGRAVSVLAWPVQRDAPMKDGDDPADRWRSS